jgi:hypothetical protein
MSAQRIVGFREEEDGFVSPQERKTDFIDPALIINGELPQWKEVGADEGTKNRTLFAVRRK